MFLLWIFKYQDDERLPVIKVDIINSDQTLVNLFNNAINIDGIRNADTELYTFESNEVKLIYS